MNLSKLFTPFTSVIYYKKSVEKPVFKSILLLFVVLFILGLIGGAVFVAQNTDTVYEITTNSTQDFVSHYPEDLTFNWDKEQLSYSYQGPLTVPFSSSMQLPSEVTPTHFAYFTKDEIKPKDIENSNTKYALMITPTKVFVSESTQSDIWNEYSLKELLTESPSLTVTKDDVKTVSDSFLNILEQEKTNLQIIAAVLFAVLFLFGKLWFFIIETVFLTLLYKLNGSKLTIKQMISLSAHIVVATGIFTTLANLIYTQIRLPLHTIAYWVIAFYIMYRWNKE